MGKPAKQQSRRSSIHTMSTSKTNMSKKSVRARRHRKQKTEETIKKLFNQLRHDSQTQLNKSTVESSVIEIEDSVVNNMDDSVIREPDVSIDTVDAPETVSPRRSKLKTIVINDDEPSIPNKNIYSMHHSTPIKNKPSLDDLILSVSRQLTDDTTNNRTKEINASSFLTIDLTRDSGFNRSTQPTIIDLDATNEQDCVLTSVSHGSSMSGDSEVTVLRRPTRSRSIASQIKRGLVNLNASDKDRILAFISENLFNGCSTPAKIPPRAPETAEDTYIKEIIIGKKLSRNSIGSNVYNPEKYVNTTGLRMVIIDGSNVAMAHGGHRYFSVKGLKIVVDYFVSRGHAVKAFVPKCRNKSGRCSDPQLLLAMERSGHVIFTPSREVQGKDINSYDDRYLIQAAAEFDGIIVSNDRFKDLIHENPRWSDVITYRVLQFNWVNGMIMFPRDPLGRNGPSLEQFLKMPTQAANKPKPRWGI